MKMSEMYMPTLREVPAEAVVESHKLLLRAGMIRSLANGLFAYLPLGLRVFRKVENIIREEMDGIGCLEFKPPVVVPGEIWQASGRWSSMGQELLRIKNRLAQDLVLSPTAEEAFTQILKFELNSYKQYPLAVYQINTKYRDEVRPRYGLMRAREFTMKDAYSYHTGEESLDETYCKFAEAYRRIFKRCGLNVIGVKADSGAMGGSGSEEFMAESAVGDDTLLLCSKCGYAANEEKASCKLEEESGGFSSQAMEEVSTPGIKTIEQLAEFFKTEKSSFIKTLIYKIEESGLLKDGFAAVCIRGDLDVNEAKLKSALKAANTVLASDEEVEKITGCSVGFAGPAGLKNIPIICDQSVMKMHDAVTGALKNDKHFVHTEPERDFKASYIFDLRTVKAGDLCACCGEPLYTKKGNELGHIFKLGTKYTKSMGMTYLDENGKQQHPLMGCYGIGVDRLTSSIVEENRDENGIVFPVSVAPYHAAIVPVKYEGGMKEAAGRLYEMLKAAGIEVLLDDRKERTGVKFKDMDLIGIPLRIVVGEKNLPLVEVKPRKEKDSRLMSENETIEFVKDYIEKHNA